MITITRRQARRLRAAFRRRSLGIAHKGPVPPLVFDADPASGLRVRHRQPHLAVECSLGGPDRPEGAVAVPLDALGDFEGRDDAPVVLEAAAPGRTAVRWEDRGIPQSREYAVPEVGSLPPFPESPADTGECPPGLLDALAEAAATTEEGSTRYALDSILLKGDTSEVVATDGRQILTQGGFPFPWGGDLLIRATPLFACKGLPRDRPVRVGRTDAHVVLTSGAWTIHLAIRAEARFPRVDEIVRDGWIASSRLSLDPEDAAFLADSLGRLPGGDEHGAPVTLDLNGRVAVRARAGAGGRVTELVLARSGYSGDPARLHTDRGYLARALRLGFAEIRIGGAGSPVACRDGRRSYLWQPLGREAAIGPTDDAVRIDSVTTKTAIGPVETHRKQEVTMVDPAPVTRPGHAAPGATPGTANGDATVGLASLIQEATSLHDVLADAKARAGRLSVALRRYRRRERLVSNTLASLKALKQEVGG